MYYYKVYIYRSKYILGHEKLPRDLVEDVTSASTIFDILAHEKLPRGPVEDVTFSPTIFDV